MNMRVISSAFDDVVKYLRKRKDFFLEIGLYHCKNGNSLQNYI